MSYYVILGDKNCTDGAMIDDHPKEMPIERHHFNNGLSIIDKFPFGISYSLSNRRAKSVHLYSMVRNSLNLMIVDSQMKTLLEKSSAVFEFLPITINNKNETISTDYYIANSLTVLDCVNLEESDFEYCPMIPTDFGAWDEIVLDEAKIPEGTDIFKFSQMDYFVVSEDFKRIIESQSDITGIRFVPMDEFDDITL